jgi:hypothetical protein
MYGDKEQEGRRQYELSTCNPVAHGESLWFFSGDKNNNHFLCKSELGIRQVIYFILSGDE